MAEAISFYWWKAVCRWCLVEKGGCLEYQIQQVTEFVFDFLNGTNLE